MGARSYQRWDEPPPPEYGGGASFGMPGPPRATKRLLWATALAFVPVFVLWLASSGAYARALDVLGLSPATWQRWAPWLPLWQLVSYSFLHAVTDPLHLVYNLLGLYFFGSMLERRLGERRFHVAYFGAVAFGALAFLAYGLARGSYEPAVGASGGVLGVMIACAVLEPYAPIYLFPFPIAIQLRWLALGYTALQLLSAAIDVKTGGGSGVAYLVHLGGMAFGFVVVKTGLVSFDPVAWWSARTRRIEVESAVRDDERLDQLLERINREGIGKLSNADRDFLKRMSGRTKRP